MISLVVLVLSSVAVSACGGGDDDGRMPGGPGGGGNQGGGGGLGGGGPGGNPGSSFPPGSEANPRVDCSVPLETTLGGIWGADTVPSWAQIDCYTAGLERKPLPQTLNRYATNAEEFGPGMNERGTEFAAYFDKLASLPGSTQAMVTLSNLPPFVDLKTNTILKHPLPPEAIDARLRVASLIAIAQKRKGRVFQLIHQWPPGLLSVDGVTDVESYKEFIRTKFAAEKTAEAKMAEKIKIEIYYPLPIELEVIPRSIPFLRNLPAAEQAALCQFILDTVHAAVRSHFSGLLVAATHNRFAINDPVFKAIDFSKWDRLDVTFFPNCDQDLDVYMDLQIENYTDVAKRSGIPWAAAEVNVVPTYFVKNAQGLGCMTKAEYDAAEPEMWRRVLERIKRVSPRSVAYGVISNPENPDSFKVISDFLETLP